MRGMIVLVLVLQSIAVVEGKGKKSAGGGKAASAKATKGGDLKAKLAANEGAAALEKRDFQAAIDKYRSAVDNDPGALTRASMCVHVLVR